MRIFFSVGEPSGDLHAARLVRELKLRAPGVECAGFGGPLMEAAGCQILFRLTELAVMGFLPVIPLIFKFVSLLKTGRQFLDEWRPAAVILIDYPGFNWWMARAAKRLGIPVFYYLPPQLWAWAPWRARRMRKHVDHVLSCLPFEEAWYRRRGIPAEFVGHPFFDEAAEKPLDGDFLKSHSAAAGLPRRTVAVLPGSRNHEVSKNFPIQIRVMRRLHRLLPDARFLVAAYKETQRGDCERLLAERAPELPVTLHVSKTSEIIELADVCLMVSGSVSLEVLARRTPAVVLFKIGRPFYWFCQVMVTCWSFTLPNLIANRPIMPEFAPIGDPRQGTIDTMVQILHRWLTDSVEYDRQIADLGDLRDKVATAGATARAAQAILDRLSPEAGLGNGAEALPRAA